MPVAVSLVKTVKSESKTGCDYFSRGAIGDTRKVTYSNGFVCVTKVQDESRNISEILAHKVARIMLLNTPVVESISPEMIAMDYIDAPMAAQFIAEKMNKSVFYASNLYTSTRSYQRMKFFDRLVANTDRNDGNYLIDENDRRGVVVYAIDHGHALRPCERGCDSDCYYCRLWPGQTWHGLYTDKQIREINRRLVGLKDTFARYGRETQYARMMQRWQILLSERDLNA